MDAVDAVEKWRESIPEGSRIETGAGAILVGAGLAAGAYMLLRGRRGLIAWALPGAVLAAGLVMLGDVLFDVRSDRIQQTEDLISAELAELDPIARAQVLRSVGEQQVRSILPGRE